MAKSINSIVLDFGLSRISGASVTQNSSTRTLCVCSDQPTTRTEAVSTYCLASVTLSAGDFTLGTSSSPAGRKLTIAQKANINVTASGTTSHIAIVDDTNLLVVTTCDAKTVSVGDQVTVNSFDIIFANPT